LLLVKMIVSDRGGLQDFVDHHGSPIKPISGFENDDPQKDAQERLQDRLQRMASAGQFLRRVQEQLNMYHTKRPMYLSELDELAHFNPDWGGRAKLYIDAYAKAIQGVKDSQTNRTNHTPAGALGSWKE